MKLSDAIAFLQREQQRGCDGDFVVKLIVDGKAVDVQFCEPYSGRVIQHPDCGFVVIGKTVTW